MEVQENLNTMIDEYNEMYDDTDSEPKSLTKKDIQNLLIESGVPEEITTKIEKSYEENFGDDLPLAEHLIDPKILKANEQRRREQILEKQVEILQNKLERTKINVETNSEKEEKHEIESVQNSDKETLDTISNSLDESFPQSDNMLEESNSDIDLETASDLDLEKNSDIALNSVSTEIKPEKHSDPNYDIILQVKPEKLDQIKSQIIDGKKYLVIPVDEDEQANVNGIDTLI